MSSAWISLLLRSVTGWVRWAISWPGLEIALERSGLGLDEADCRISPDLAGKTYLRFSKRDELFDLGRQAALNKLPEILDALEIDNNATDRAFTYPNKPPHRYS